MPGVFARPTFSAVSRPVVRVITASLWKPTILPTGGLAHAKRWRNVMSRPCWCGPLLLPCKTYRSTHNYVADYAEERRTCTEERYVVNAHLLGPFMIANA